MEDEKRSDAITEKPEKSAVMWIVGHYPSWITPDILTSLALLFAAFASACYWMSSTNNIFLWGASFFIALHWLTDSTDGRLAIYRKIPRPNYGHYVDHMLDAVSFMLLMLGLAFAGVLKIELSFSFIALFYIVMLHSAFMDKIKGTYMISYFGIGATEMRMGIVLLNSTLYFFPHAIFFGKHLIEWILIGFFVLWCGMFTTKVVQSLLMLKREDEATLKIRQGTSRGMLLSAAAYKAPKATFARRQLAPKRRSQLQS
jgi:archaetidylinositol phosphate synthase